METESPQIESTKREMVERMLRAERPEADFADDEVLFDQIIDDYADYARLLTAEHERQDAEQRYKDNIETSMMALEEYRTAQGLEQTAIDKAIDAIKHQGQAASQGIFTPEAIQNVLRAIDYDNAIAAAELRGRNARIQEDMSRQTSIMPRLGGGDAYQQPGGSSIFDLARQA